MWSYYCCKSIGLVYPLGNRCQVPVRQHPLSCSIDQACYDHNITEASASFSKALALSCAPSHDNDWMNVVLYKPINPHLQNLMFPTFPWSTSNIWDENVLWCICHRVADFMVDHQIGCSSKGNRISWHDTLRDWLFSSSVSCYSPQEGSLLVWLWFIQTF